MRAYHNIKFYNILKKFIKNKFNYLKIIIKIKLITHVMSLQILFDVGSFKMLIIVFDKYCLSFVDLYF